MEDYLALGCFSRRMITSPLVTMRLTSSPSFQPCPSMISFGIVNRVLFPILTSFILKIAGMTDVIRRAILKYHVLWYSCRYYRWLYSKKERRTSLYH